MIEYGRDHTCQHGEPWDECPKGCQPPTPEPPAIDWYDLETPPQGHHNDPRADPTPTPPTNGHAALTPEREAYRDKLRSLLLDTKGLDNIPEPEPLISNVLQRNTLAWLVGPPASAKTLIALDMAGSIATGETWQGHPVQQHPVLYLIAEGAQGIRARVRAWENAMNLTMTGVQFLPVAVHSTKPNQWNAFCDLAAELTPGLIVIDTQARVTVGLEENAAKDMGQYVDQLERLRRASKACVLSLHHTGRNSTHLRGSTTIDGAATTIIMVEKEDEIIKVVNDPEKGGKQKDMAPFPTIHLRAVSYETSVVVMPCSEDDLIRPDSDTCDRLHTDWWRLFGGDQVTKKQVLDAGVCSVRTFERYVRVLIRGHIVRREGKTRSALYTMVMPPG